MYLAESQPIDVTLQTQGSPIWLAVAAFAVSGLALVFSGLQFFANWSETRRTRPRIKVFAYFTDVMFIDGKARKVVSVDIQNLGRESTRLTSLILEGDGMAINGLHTVSGYDEDTDKPHYTFESNPEIAGFSTSSFTIDAASAKPEVLSMKIRFGHGQIFKMDVRLNQFVTSKSSGAWRELLPQRLGSNR